MASLLRLGVVFSFFFSAISLSILVLRTFSFGKRALYAEPRGNVKKGIFYAFGHGMMPWEKESARKHLPTYIAGTLYHTGIFAALFYLFSLVFSLGLPRASISVLRLFFALGFFCGMALFFKRMLLPSLKKISCADDFVANLTVDIFVSLAFVHTYFNQATLLFFLTAILMFLYIPMGKIRHCAFFFYVRILFGLFYGRRNTLPPKVYKV